MSAKTICCLAAVVATSTLVGCSSGRTTIGSLPVDWYRATDTACLQAGDDAAFDSATVGSPEVMYIDDGYNMRMFYVGIGGDGTPVGQIGIANKPTAGDDTSWKRSPANPVLKTTDKVTSWTDIALLRGDDGWVIREEGRIDAYVVDVSKGAERKVSLYKVQSEDDGLTWSALEGPLMVDVRSPSVLKIDDLYRMWYVRQDGDSFNVHYAISEDGTKWVSGHSGPVFAEEVTEQQASAGVTVTCDDGRYLMWSRSRSNGKPGIALATSRNGVDWMTYPTNPVVTFDGGEPANEQLSSGPSVLPIVTTTEGEVESTDGYLMYYASNGVIRSATTIPDDEKKEPVVPRPTFTTSMKEGVDPRFEPLRFIDAYGQQTEPMFEFDADTRDEWKRWRRGFKSALKKVIGMPEVEGWEVRATKGETKQFEGYKRIAFTIESAPGLYVPAYLLVPDGLTDARPAVLCSHGHGNGMNALIGLTDEGEQRQFGQGYQHDFGLQSVRAGYVTLVFDQVGFGRRRDFTWNSKHKMGNACEQPSKSSLHWGMSMTGLRVYDALRMIDFLQSRPEVDPTRIGMVGISGGGLVTQFTAALDDRIKAACVSGYCNRYEACILGVRHCIDNYVPSLGLVGNNDDVACLIAPRALLIESGTQDPIFPIDATRAALRKLKRCYSLLDAEDNLESDIFDAGHQFSGEKTWDFFRKHLGE